MLVATVAVHIEGIKTNIEFQKKILKNDAFIKGEFNTNFLNTFH